MAWKKDNKRKAEGYWACCVKRLEYSRQWTKANPEKVYLNGMRQQIKRKRQRLEGADRCL